MYLLQTLGFSLSEGILQPLSRYFGSPAYIPPTDRFYLGGPMNLRGFKAFNVGPRDGGVILFVDFLT